ncbi:hypothetical protein GGX14DRAFT_463211 [Mycena pura]|uniref:Small secreted protein n=1 Tax=Mycena pura TaxID=153505 RepID=A0AAD6YAQ0_9AGAR|nr:hypothetical protein GGX14DRAFT_463211 [Mycena pura]
MFPRILSFGICALALARATQTTTLKSGTYTIRNAGTGDQLVCLHADNPIALSSIPVVPPTAGQWVVYLLAGSASVYSMYNRNSTGFAVPEVESPFSPLLILTGYKIQDDSMVALLGMAGMVPGHFSIDAVGHHTSRGDHPAKFVITNVPWGPNRDNRTWAAPIPGTSQKHLLRLEQANGGALQQWEFTSV